jgi:hypothetical protein
MIWRAVALLAAACFVAAGAVPTPESHFGHRMGADRKLLDWGKVVSYFQALDDASDRIVTRDLGKSTEGRPFIAAWISNAETLAKLDHYQGIQKRLADPRKTTQEEAARLAEQGKVVVMITCSIHSTEVASTSTAVQFAYDLLTSDKPKLRAIRDNVILILVPSLNPDGVDKVTTWYRKTLGTPYEGTSPPELYHKYVGHDNNRDWYIFSQAETRLAVSQLHNTWHPQIVYDVHQQGQNASRMFVPPWMDPIEPNIDPLIVQQCNMIGTGMAADLTAAGKKGIALNAIYDFWTPARHYQAYHGGLRILSESASARLASPVRIRPEEIAQTAPGYSPREPTWNHLEPWMGGDWNVGEITEYQLVAWESLLWQAAMRRKDFLENFFTIGLHSINRTAPAFVIPKRQRDPGATKILLDTLRFGMVETEETGESWIVPMRQPYSGWAKTLLERQDYPDLRLYPGGPPKRPYDVTAHTLPLLMGVDVYQKGSYPPAAPKKSHGPWPASDTDSWRKANEAWSRGASVWRDPDSGDFSPERRDGWKEYARRLRIGLYRSYIPVMDEGWTRWVLEKFGFAYESVKNPDVIAGGLRARFDAIIIPEQTPSSIHNGYRPGTMPPEITGGIGEQGAQSLLEFARAGGTLILLNDSTDYALGHLGVAVRNGLRGIPSRDFYCPGSLLNVTLDPHHRLAKGLPDAIPVWFEGSPAWEVGESSGNKVVARYGSEGLLASGWLLGEKHLAGKAAIVEAPMGKGSIVLFGMRPQYRAQSYLTMKLLFNAMLPE